MVRKPKPIFKNDNSQIHIQVSILMNNDFIV
jgi:hypothetical protein